MVTNKLHIPVVPFLLTQILASNVGGTATLIGDPPNIMIGSAVKELTFVAFIENLTPVVILCMAAVLFVMDVLYRKQMVTKPELQAEIMQMDETRSLKDRKLLARSLFVLGLTILGFFTHSFTHIESSVVALFGAFLLLFLEGGSQHAVDFSMRKVEWVLPLHRHRRRRPARHRLQPHRRARHHHQRRSDRRHRRQRRHLPLPGPARHHRRGSAAFGRWAASHIHSKAGALLATFALGVLIFIDDYFNCLTVGSVMTPVTDSQKISRVKLAYLIDATAAPICMIAPISSWAAAVSGVAAKLDTGVSGIQLFIEAIPYNFYSLLTIVFVITMVVLGVDYGPMAAAELKAAQTGDLGALSDEHEEGSSRANMWDMLIPIFLLIIFCVIGLIYVGGFWNPETNAGDFIAAFGDTDAFVGLPWGALIALVLSIIYLCARRVITFKGAMGCMTKGFNAMVPAILILTFAVSLKSMTGLLGAADYVEGLMKQASEGLFMLLPAIIFVVACLLAFATGTSWGTFGILIPIVLPIFNAAPDLQIMGISACLAGAVCGDHCSPISDTTIMASAGANCNHIDHVSTQIPYAVTVAAICFVNYILAAFIRNVVISLAIGVVMVIGTLLVIRSVQSRKTA